MLYSAGAYIYFNIIYNNMSPNMTWISHKDQIFKKEVTDVMLENI